MENTDFAYGDNSYQYDGSGSTGLLSGPATVLGLGGSVYAFVLKFLYGNYVPGCQPPGELPPISQVAQPVAFLTEGIQNLPLTLASRTDLMAIGKYIGATFVFVTPVLPAGSGTYTVNWYIPPFFAPTGGGVVTLSGNVNGVSTNSITP